MKLTADSSVPGRDESVVTQSLDLYPGERVWFSRQHGLDGLEVLHGRDSPRLWKVCHDTYTLCIVYQVGNCGRPDSGSYWRYRGRDQATAAGEVMLMEPGEVHSTQRIVGGTGTFDVFMVQAMLFEQIASELGLTGPFHLRQASSADPELYRALEALARGMYLGDGPFEQRQRLVCVLRLVLTRCAEKRERYSTELAHTQVTRIYQHVERSCSEPFNLTVMAAAAAMSRSSLCHTLPRTLGLTPRELYSVLRVRKAKRLLAAGTPPSEVAALSGFSDQPQLTRHFKQWWGTTPARYARMLGAERDDGAWQRDT